MKNAKRKAKHFKSAEIIWCAMKRIQMTCIICIQMGESTIKENIEAENKKIKQNQYFRNRADNISLFPISFIENRRYTKITVQLSTRVTIFSFSYVK